MHRHRSSGDIRHRREVRSVDLADRNRCPDTVEDFEADRLVRALGELLELRLRDGAQVQGSLGGLGESDDADAESEVSRLAILLHEAASLECREESAHGRLVQVERVREIGDR